MSTASGQHPEPTPSDRVLALLAAAAADDSTPVAGEDRALSAFRCGRPRTRVRRIQGRPLAAALAVSATTALMVTGGVAAAAPGSLSEVARQTAGHVLGSFGLDLPGLEPAPPDQRREKAPLPTDPAVRGPVTDGTPAQIQLRAERDDASETASDTSVTGAEQGAETSAAGARDGSSPAEPPAADGLGEVAGGDQTAAPEAPSPTESGDPGAVTEPGTATDPAAGEEQPVDGSGTATDEPAPTEVPAPSADPSPSTDGGSDDLGSGDVGTETPSGETQVGELGGGGSLAVPGGLGVGDGAGLAKAGLAGDGLAAEGSLGR